MAWKMFNILKEIVLKHAMLFCLSKMGTLKIT